MSPGDKIRILRYHATSGHVLQEVVDERLSDVEDGKLLDKISNILAEEYPEPFIKIMEVTSESPVLIRKNRIDLVQIGYGFMVADLGAAVDAEDSAIQRARRSWGQDDD